MARTRSRRRRRRRRCPTPAARQAPIRPPERRPRPAERPQRARRRCTATSAATSTARSCAPSWTRAPLRTASTIWTSSRPRSASPSACCRKKPARRWRPGSSPWRRSRGACGLRGWRPARCLRRRDPTREVLAIARRRPAGPRLPARAGASRARGSRRCRSACSRSCGGAGGSSRAGPTSDAISCCTRATPAPRTRCSPSW
mmetsp:Transcript_24851/g.70257  ORF Transcript_24851/g.70257 Transcript_24851/m.70257 type:complete len:201 (+) Transcript_24851:270-872(+)